MISYEKEQTKEWDSLEKEWDSLTKESDVFHFNCLSISFHNYTWEDTDDCAGICLKFIIKGGRY